MKTLAYPPVYVAVFVLHALTAGTVALGRFESPATVSVVCAALYAIALFLGYALSRRSFVASNGTQVIQASIVTVTGFVWVSQSGMTGLFVVVGLALLFVRDATLTTRRNLYFDLSILLALFYDAIGAENLPWRWAIAVAFLLGLVFLLMADFTERRLEQLNLGDARARLHPGLSNAVFSTTLVLAVAAVIYFLMPQPRALELALLPDQAPPKSWAADTSDGNDPVRAGEKPEGPGRNGGQAGGRNGSPDAKGTSGSGSQGRGGAGQGATGMAEKGNAQRKSNQRDGGAGAQSSDGKRPIALFDMVADRPLYLRTHAYMMPGADGWQEAPRMWVNGRGNELYRKDRTESNVRLWIRVVQPLDERIPLGFELVRMAFPADRYQLNADFTVAAPRPLAPGTLYRVDTVVRYLGERASGDAYPGRDMPEPYLRLPKGVSAKVGKLAREIVAGRTVPSDRAAALEQYLHAHYTAGVFKPRAGIDPSEQFLFETQAGASREFAEALTVMLRSIGIPARIVGGYRARRENPLLEAYEIWPTDHHHWVEAYIERAWVTFEPTPWATLPAKAGAESAWVAAREYVRLAKEPPTDALLAGEPIPEIAEWCLWLVLAYGWIMTYGALALLLLIAFAAAAQRWRWWSRPLRDALDRLRLRHARSGDPARVARRAYEAVERIAARRGLTRGSGENHTDYLKRLMGLRPHLRLPCETLAVQFGTARYGRVITPEGAQEALQSARLIASLIDERG